MEGACEFSRRFFLATTASNNSVLGVKRVTERRDTGPALRSLGGARVSSDSKALNIGSVREMRQRPEAGTIHSPWGRKSQGLHRALAGLSRDSAEAGGPCAALESCAKNKYWDWAFLGPSMLPRAMEPPSSSREQNWWFRASYLCALGTLDKGAAAPLHVRARWPGAPHFASQSAIRSCLKWGSWKQQSHLLGSSDGRKGDGAHTRSAAADCSTGAALSSPQATGRQDWRWEGHMQEGAGVFQ